MVVFDVVIEVVVIIRHGYDVIVNIASTSAADVVVFGEAHPCRLCRLVRRLDRRLAEADDHFTLSARLQRQEDRGRDELIEDGALTEACQSDDGLDDGYKNGDEKEANHGV